MDRKLATILVGDFVGSTAAMQKDEEAALARVLRGLDLVADCVSHHDGRIFNTAGDAILAEFDSPMNGLKAVIEARSLLGAERGLAPTDMRFGLHIADVVRVGDDLRGDGVNLAARLQQSADPGEILVSGLLADHVRRASPCTMHDVGSRRLRGVDDQVRVFRVGSVIDRHVYQTAPTVDHPAPDLRPNSVAVLPFEIGGAPDDDQRFLADGLTDDIIHELSFFRQLFVSSRTASAALRVADPEEIGKVLGVRYVLSGSVRRLGARVRLNVSLSRTTDGGVVWADKVQRPFDEVLEAMEELAARVAATVSGRIDHAEISAARMKRPDNMNAYEYYLRGLERHRICGVSDANAAEARDWFRRSQEADPGFARPIAMEVCSWSYLPDFDLNEASRMLDRAMELDTSDPELHRIFGIVQIKLNGDFAASRRHHEMALKLAPNDAYIMGRCAAFYTFDGQPERALKLLERAEVLDPFLPVWVVEERVAALYALGRYEEANEEARNLVFQTKRSRLYRAACRVARGDIARATELVAQALADDPGLSTEYVVDQELFRDGDMLRELQDRLIRAGLPQGAATPQVSQISVS